MLYSISMMSNIAYYLHARAKSHARTATRGRKRPSTEAPFLEGTVSYTL